MNPIISFVYQEINIERLTSHLGNEASGGQVWFVGTVRRDADCKDLLYLEYEAYEEMALSLLKKLVDEAEKRWRICGCAIVHRLGRVPVGEASLLLGVSAAHRAEAFEACRFLLEKLKEEVPIWKKEVDPGGGRWKPNAMPEISGEGTVLPRTQGDS